MDACPSFNFVKNWYKFIKVLSVVVTVGFSTIFNCEESQVSQRMHAGLCSYVDIISNIFLNSWLLFLYRCFT